MKKSVGARIVIIPTPVLVVGTYDMSGKPNAMTVAWGGVCCSEPPCIAIAIRKATYTYGNIVHRKAFTVHPATEPYVRAADYFGIASGMDADKFAVTGLTPIKAEFVDAPCIEEFPLVLECRLLHTVEIGLHTQFIGEIVSTKIDEEVLADNGRPDMKKLKPIAYTPEVRDYFTLGHSLGRAFKIGRTIDEGREP
jgi:flavin reductase (DIM6/NTAB) family NADH-FMN oxidoreductase RutF